MGLTLLVLVNVFRICTLYFLGVYAPSAFEVAHIEVWPIIIILATAAEFVGWTVLGGKEFSPTIATNMGIKDASGDTIVNAKLGGRIDFGEHSSFYVGYGRALTGTVWYKDILRVEYRLAF